MKEFNPDFGTDFAGGIIPADFNFDFNSDFAGGYQPVVAPVVVNVPTEYIVVPPGPGMIQVQAEQRTIIIEPESVAL